MKINVKDINSSHMCHATATQVIPAINEMWEMLKKLERQVAGKEVEVNPTTAEDSNEEAQETPKRRGRKPKTLADAQSV